HRPEILLGLPALALALLAARWLLARLPSRRELLYWTPRGLLAATLAMAFYAWFLRQPGGALAAHDAYAFRAFGWYVDPRVLLPATVLSTVMTTGFWLAPSTFVVFIGMSTFVFNRLRIVPEHFWAARRFVPIILPGVCLAIAFALAPAAARGVSVARRLTGSA